MGNGLDHPTGIITEENVAANLAPWGLPNGAATMSDGLNYKLFWEHQIEAEARNSQAARRSP